MNNEDFKKVLDSRLQKIRDVLDNKAKEYASGVDRLHNFKKAAEVMRVSPQFALLGMLSKHITSAIDMIEANNERGARFTPATIDEKLGDIINYFILLEALMLEELQ